jgi:hypothetical protein
MTVFGWDASHFDGLLSTAILATARAEGIGFFTHKIGEGLSDTEGSHDDTALAAARSAGIEFVGGYLIPRSNATVDAQVGFWLRLADGGEPWWRTFPGWFWQVDLERWSYDSVSAVTGIAAARQLRERTGRQVVLYASHSQYGDQLGGWDGPLWNADYTSRPAAGFAAMYPGDEWMPLHSTWRGGWAPYGDPVSPRPPAILQFTSSATIAGLSTCDANAYRGTVDELRTLMEGKADMAAMQQSDMVEGFAARTTIGNTLADAGTWRDWWYEPPGQPGGNPPPAGSRADLLMQAVDAILAGTTGGVDLDALAAKVAVQLAPLVPTAQQVAAQIIQQLAGK